MLLLLFYRSKESEHLDTETYSKVIFHALEWEYMAGYK